MNKLLLIGLLGLTVIACQKEETTATIDLPYYISADLTPQWLSKEEVAQGLVHHIDSFEFTNQQGEIISKKNLEGKIYLANFFFTSCPGICPKLTANMEIVQNAFSDDEEVALLSHSVMPWIDSVGKLSVYADYNNVIPGKWHLLTGDVATINELARHSYFAEKEMGLLKDRKDFLHTENMILVDQNGHIRGVYNGTIEVEMKRIIKDINRLKVGA
ncbi:MAG: SCO family protein [Bacteroidota bacterium]